MNKRNLTTELGLLLMQAANERIAPNVVADLAYETLYQADVDGLIASELSDYMQELAQFVEPPVDDENTTVSNIQYYLEQEMLTAVITYADERQIFIFIQRGMIFVADCCWQDLCKRIDADDTDSFESYDTSDGASYYLHSLYAEHICDALLYLSNRML